MTINACLTEAFSIPTTLNLNIPLRPKAPTPPDTPQLGHTPPPTLAPLNRICSEYKNLSPIELKRLACQCHGNAKDEVLFGGGPSWSRLLQVPRWFLMIGIGASRGCENRSTEKWIEPLEAWETLLKLEKYQREPPRNGTERGRQTKQEEKEVYNCRHCGGLHETLSCPENTMIWDEDEVNEDYTTDEDSGAESSSSGSDELGKSSEQGTESETNAPHYSDRFAKLKIQFPETHQALARERGKQTQQNTTSCSDEDIFEPVSDTERELEHDMFRVVIPRPPLAVCSPHPTCGGENRSGESDNNGEDDCIAARFGPENCRCRDCMERIVSW